MAFMDKQTANELYFNSKFISKLEHLEKQRQLDLVFEWVKTGHVTRSEFKSLIGRIQEGL